MNATVSTRERAWQLADKLFPTDYMKDERDSLRAGYPVFNTTSTDDKYTGFHISDLNTALELNMGAETIRINIEDQEAEIKNNFDKLLQYVTDKRKSAELHERQKYKAYCRIDYDDDDEVIKLIYAAVLEEMTDLIKDFNPEALTNRQKLLICMYVKEAYDNRDRTAPTDDKVRFAVQSMMLKERLK